MIKKIKEDLYEIKDVRVSQADIIKKGTNSKTGAEYTLIGLTLDIDGKPMMVKTFDKDMLQTQGTEISGLLKVNTFRGAKEYTYYKPNSRYNSRDSFNQTVLDKLNEILALLKELKQ
ncbi:hypothetical protein KBH77_01305 [Patescibacteria group bacterium]|nr:hypothetical protein [Patescibacteria group bacterium]